MLRRVGAIATLPFLPNSPLLNFAAGKAPKPTTAPDKENKPETEDPEFPWSEIFQLADELKELGFKSDYINIETLKTDVETLKRGYTPTVGWLNGLIKLHKEYEQDPEKSSLVGLYANMLGKIDPKFIAPEETISYYMEKHFLKYSFDNLKFFLGILRDFQKKGIKIGIAERDIDGVLKQQLLWFSPGPEGNELGKPTGHPVIRMDSTIPNPTAGGEDLFEKHQEKVAGWLKTFDFLQQQNLDIELYSRHYGQSSDPMPPYLAGSFRMGRSQTGEWVGKLKVNMEELPEDSSTDSVEETVAHELLGHGFDTDLNRSAAVFLRPSDNIERTTFQMQISQDHNWGWLGLTIKDLFRKNPDRMDIEITPALVHKEPVDVDQFVRIIKRYPLNVIFLNLYNVGFNKIGVRMGEDVVSKISHAARTYHDAVSAKLGLKREPYIGMESEARQGQIREAFERLNSMKPSSPFEAGKTFEDWNIFVDEYLPVARAAADGGNKMARLVVWGLENYRKEFGNYDLVWNVADTMEDSYVPSKERNAANVYVNYCQYVVAYMTLRHAVFENVKEIRSMFTDKDWEAFCVHFFTVTVLANRELWAEGVGMSHYLGERLVGGDKCSYRDGLKELASLLVKGPADD